MHNFAKQKQTPTPSDRILYLLHQLYPSEQAVQAHQRILNMVSDVSQRQAPTDNYFSERTITLITYGDTLQSLAERPLQTLHRFLQLKLSDIISTVHILPFYPYSSDDGFSVIDYYAVNSALGDWQDIRQLGGDFRLMFDAVINHMSAQSDWFKAFLADDTEYQNLFFTADPAADLRAVTRPRTSPLLTPFQKSDGSTVHVWTTFSADQVDLDYRDSETLLRILRVLLFYVEQGADVLRLDAIAYMWKQVGTSCIHLSQTHMIIQLMRAVLDLAAPQVILITETNVPHPENVSYFGSTQNPEAQLVYNFTLPPLLLHTMLSNNAGKLCNWINTLEAPSERTTFFNFTASHDGIGVRPIEGILSPDDLQVLISKVESGGGKVSYKNNPDGSRGPYELNITYVDAVVDHNQPVSVQAAQFLLSQAIMLALAGVPAIYIHSLIGSRNDIVGMEQAGYPRAINRRKLNLPTVLHDLSDPLNFRSIIFDGYCQLIRARRSSPAFHPKSHQTAHLLNEGQVLGLERTALSMTEKVYCLFNVTGRSQIVETRLGASTDMLSNDNFGRIVSLLPYQSRWLKVSA